MKLVLTLVVRDEADVIDANVAFHLSAGVDFVLALDNGSADGTVEILESYARTGRLHLVRESGAHLGRGESQTMLARLAAIEFGADWVITADADQFYWPCGGTLKEVVAAVPERYGVVSVPRRLFVPRPDGDPSFFERMTVRLSPCAPINDPVRFTRAASNVVHRAHPGVVVAPGNHGVSGALLPRLRGWYPIEVLHFPVRSVEQCERKYVGANPAWLRNAVRRTAVTAHRDGRFREYYDTLVVDDVGLGEGLANGALAIDTRLRDALRTLPRDDVSGGRPGSPAPSPASLLEFARPSPAEEASYALDVAVLREADAVRMQRELDQLGLRLSSLEEHEGTRSGRSRRRRRRGPASHRGSIPSFTIRAGTPRT